MGFFKALSTIGDPMYIVREFQILFLKGLIGYRTELISLQGAYCSVILVFCIFRNLPPSYNKLYGSSLIQFGLVLGYVRNHTGDQARYFTLATHHGIELPALPAIRNIYK